MLIFEHGWSIISQCLSLTRLAYLSPGTLEVYRITHKTDNYRTFNSVPYFE